SLLEIAGASISARVGDPFRALTVISETLVSAADAAASLSAAENVTMPVAAPVTPYSHALTPRRSVSLARASLSDIKAIKNAFGATVNDVVLAAVALALRVHLAEAGAEVARPLIASIPVSTRKDDEESKSFNRVAAMFVGLPVHVEDPVGAIEEVRRNS